MKKNMLYPVRLWWRIIRPHTLFAAVAPVLVGLMVAGMQGDASLQGLTAIVTLLSALSLQVFANLVNDYYDYQKGADKKGRVGFRRALAEGEVSVQQMRVALVVTLAVVVLSGFYLVLYGGWLILGIGLTAILFAWLYTATRYSLAYLGIADLFVFLFFGVLATVGTAWLQTGRWEWQAFSAGGVNGVISMCVLCINNLRDRDDDARVGKRTIPVRFGHKAGYAETMLCTLLSGLFALQAFGLCWPCLIVLPMAWLCYKVIRAEGQEYNHCLVAAGKINMVYVLLVLATLLTTP